MTKQNIIETEYNCMNLFTARLTGKMVSTDRFESDIRDMLAQVERWRAVEKSPELAEYYALKKEVESEAFQSRKSELKNRKYRDTEEGKKMHELEELRSPLRMKGYKYAESSETFQNFLKFRETDEFNKIMDSRARRQSSELRTYYRIYQSAFYKNYQQVLHSAELQRLQELERETSDPEFQKSNALWADSKRWEHSEEYRKEQRLKELASSADIKFYFTQRAEQIDWAELFRPAFSDDMSSSKNWQAGFGYVNPAMKDGHSRTDELQAYTGGKNTFFAEGRMDIETREETCKALAWDGKKGFVEKVFPYTSDVMNCREAFKQEEGLFMAKVRSQGSGHHFFGLSSGKPGQPMPALYYCDGDIHYVGLIDGKKSVMTPLRGMLRSMYHVYTLRWTKKELVWFVNNMEVLRQPNTLSSEQMFYLAQSFLPANEKGGEGKLKIQWARVYRSVE